MAAIDPMDPFQIQGRPVEVVGDAEPEVVYDFDLDAVIAERGPEKPFNFKFDGEGYTLPARPDMVAAAMLTSERLMDGFERLFGTAQWERIQASEKVLDDEGLKLLFERYQKHTGMALGESRASANSSRGTARR